MRSHPKIVEKLKALLKKWAEGDFKTDPQLNLIPTLYNKLKSEGHDFSSLSEMVNNLFLLNTIHKDNIFNVNLFL